MGKYELLLRNWLFLWKFCLYLQIPQSNYGIKILLLPSNIMSTTVQNCRTRNVELTSLVYCVGHFHFLIMPELMTLSMRHLWRNASNNTGQKFWLFFRRWSIFPFVDFGMLNKKIAMKGIDWVQFPRKINLLVIPALHTISLTYWILTGVPRLIAPSLSLPSLHKPRRISCYPPAIVC
jgi:hypothetical protein